MRSVKSGTYWFSGCSCAVALLMAGSASALVIVVPTQQPTIQAALNAAGNGDIVLVLDGVHSGRGNYNLDFMGKAITLQSLSGPASCTIDGQSTAQNQRRIFNFHTGETNAAVVQGFTIKGGWQFNGPAFMFINSSPTIRNCVITENHADCWGGAIYYDSNASPKFTDCKIVNNYSSDDGGAVFGFQGSPVFTNCLIANNEGSSTGGAILAFDSASAPKLINCTVTGNHANWGAAIYSNNIQIENSIIHGNLGDSMQIRNPGTTGVNVKFSNVQGGHVGVGNVDVAPQFVDAAGEDFHLLRTSACVDAGDPAAVNPAGSMDIDGDPRTFGVRIDMGIDEFRKAGDVTGDHFTNIDDLVQVIINWGPCQISPADLDGNFMIDIDDLVAVITNWG